MDWLNAAGDAVSSGFDAVSGYATDAFSWIGDNPEAANMIGGVAMGAAQGYMQNKQADDRRAFECEMYDKKREDAFSKPGEIGNYGSHRNTIAGKGLISGGMITGED
jgi:hypothetical protein